MNQWDWLLTKLGICELQAMWIRQKILEGKESEALKHLDRLSQELQKMKDWLGDPG